jgi:RNA polymerase sigma-70 factor (ECF subfamily)
MRARTEAKTERVVALPRLRLTDAELVNAVAEGDHAALAAVWERYVNDVRGMISSVLGPDPGTDDLVQNVFLGFYRNAGRLGSPSALRSYLLGIAVRACAFEIRTRTRRHRWFRFTRTGELPEGPLVESPIEPRDSLRALRDVLERLPELPRMAFILRYAEDLSPEEVAIALGVSNAKARRAITKGRESVLALGQREPALQRYLRARPEGA